MIEIKRYVDELHDIRQTALQIKNRALWPSARLVVQLLRIARTALYVASLVDRRIEPLFQQTRETQLEIVADLQAVEP